MSYYVKKVVLGEEVQIGDTVSLDGDGDTVGLIIDTRREFHWPEYIYSHKVIWAKPPPWLDDKENPREWHLASGLWKFVI